MKKHKTLLLSAIAAGVILSLPASQAALKADNSTPYTMKATDLVKKEQELTGSPLMQSVKASIKTLDNAEVEKVAPGRAANPAIVKRVESIISASDWDYLFPLRAPEYTYTNFLKAVSKFPAVCGSYSDGRDADAICRKSLATMFAHFAQETGGHESWRPEAEWRQALVYLREVGWTEGQKGGYNGECNPNVWQGQTWPCGKDKDGDFLSYFGRGAKQLSYNYNYGPFSEAMYGDVKTLLEKPELVADTWLNLASAIFFFVYPQPPKPSMLHVIDGTWKPNDRDKANGLVSGFGVTIQIINGGVECGGATENAQSLNRIAYYKEFANYLKVPIADDEVLGCKNMKQFDEGGAGALPIYFNVTVVDDAGSDGASDKTDDVTPAPQVNVAPVARIAGPVGAVEAGSLVSLSAEASTDANGDKLSYSWMSQDGQTLSGADKAVINFSAPQSDKDAQYVVSLTVSDGSLSSTATYTLNVKAKAAADDAKDEPAGDSGAISYPAWSASQSWKPGDIVNNHGALFQCKPLPEGAWCNVAPTYYEPGAGLAWGDAWKAL